MPIIVRSGPDPIGPVRVRGRARSGGGGGRTASSRRPGLVAADQVGGVFVAHGPQGVGGQRGGVALRAHHHHRPVEPGGLGDPVGTEGVEPPLEHVALDDERPGQVALQRTLGCGPDVDHQRTRRGGGLERPQGRCGRSGAGPRPPDRRPTGSRRVVGAGEVEGADGRHDLGADDADAIRGRPTRSSSWWSSFGP